MDDELLKHSIQQQRKQLQKIPGFIGLPASAIPLVS